MGLRGHHAGEILPRNNLWQAANPRLSFQYLNCQRRIKSFNLYRPSMRVSVHLATDSSTSSRSKKRNTRKSLQVLPKVLNFDCSECIRLDIF